MTTGPNLRITLASIVDAILPLLLLALLIGLCIQLLRPFVGLLVWTIILAICFRPIHKKLIARGRSNRFSATILGLVLATLVLVPTAIAAASAARSIPKIVATAQTGDYRVPAPPPRLQELPVVGDRAHAIWMQASTDLPTFTQTYRPQIASFIKALLTFGAGMFVGVLLLVLAIVFSSICLAYSVPLHAFTTRVFERITGDQRAAVHYMDIIGATVRSVANGVIGVAFVQALLVGVGFFAIGMPGAGLLSLLAMILGVLQIPVVLLTLPAIFYAFATETTTVAVIFTIWSVLAGLSDAVLKPMMIGHGLEVPMPVILLGVIGGVMAFGLVGLFIGAVLLAVGYVLLLEWVGPSPKSAQADVVADNLVATPAE